MAVVQILYVCLNIRSFASCIAADDDGAPFAFNRLCWKQKKDFPACERCFSELNELNRNKIGTPI